MLYENNFGKILSPEEVDSLPYWRLEAMEIHVFEVGPDEMEEC